MEDEQILKSIDKLYQRLKGTQYERDALNTKREVTRIIEDITLQSKADGALEDYLDDEGQ